MIYSDELSPYFTQGTIRSKVRVAEYLIPLMDESGVENSEPETDRKIREQYEPEIAEKLVGREWIDFVEDSVVSWSEEEEPHKVGAGFFVWAEEVDWEAGTLKSEFLPDMNDREEHLFWDEEEHLISEFERADYNIDLRGLCFELSAIEMLLPIHDVSAEHAIVAQSKDRKSIGRPRKWDWDGAMAVVVSRAQTPDGLPTGPGSQARIEEIIRNWFIDVIGDTPAPSQIRQRAARIVKEIEASKKPETP